MTVGVCWYLNKISTRFLLSFTSHLNPFDDFFDSFEEVFDLLFDEFFNSIVEL